MVDQWLVNSVWQPLKEPGRPRKPRRGRAAERGFPMCVVEEPGIGILDAVDRERIFLRRCKPAEVASANEDLGLGAGFGKESGRLERALTSADHGDALALEHAEIAVISRVGDERRRELGELWRAPGEGDYPGGDDHLLCKEGLAVVELDTECMCVRGDTDHATPLESRDGMVLEPSPVIDEACQRHRLCALQTGCSLVASEAERMIRIGDVGGLPSGA